jgi:hypothetical protein
MANTYEKALVKTDFGGYGHQDIYWYLVYHGVSDTYSLHTRVDNGKIERIATRV